MYGINQTCRGKHWMVCRGTWGEQGTKCYGLDCKDDCECCFHTHSHGSKARASAVPSCYFLLTLILFWQVLGLIP